MSFFKTIRRLLLELLFLAGLAAIAYGAWLIYQPAGYIAGGLLLSAVTVIVMLGGTDESDKRH